MFQQAGAPVAIPMMAPPGPESLGPRVAPQRTTNGLCITSMVLGIVGIPFIMIGFLLGPLALIFGIVGVTKVKKSGQAGMGMAVTGIVLGTFIVAIWIFLASFLGAIFNEF